MAIPSRTQMSSSENWVSYPATTQQAVTGSTGIMADAAGILVFTQNGRVSTWNLVQGQTPPLRGDYVIEVGTTIIVHVAY
jgi:hypothetical protein